MAIQFHVVIFNSYDLFKEVDNDAGILYIGSNTMFSSFLLIDI